MSFPRSPANEQRHTENAANYIWRNSRWEKLLMPCVNVSGETSDLVGKAASTVSAGKDWFYCDIDSLQHHAVERIRMVAAFSTNTETYSGFGIWSKSDGDFMAATKYGDKNGLTRWAQDGGGGMQNPNWTTNRNNSLSMGSRDTTRRCKPSEPQFLDCSFAAVDEQHCIMSWRFISVVTFGAVPIFNTARAVINKPITDIGAVFMDLADASATFEHGRIDVEVF